MHVDITGALSALPKETTLYENGMDGNTVGSLSIVHDPSDSINVDGVLAKMLRSRDGPAILQNQGLETPQLAYRSSHRVRAAHHQNSRRNTAQSSLADMNSFFDDLPVHAHEEPHKSARMTSGHDDMVRLVGAQRPHHDERSAGEEWDSMASSMDAAVHLYHTEGDAALEKALQVVRWALSLSLPLSFSLCVSVHML
jgi:hypothetical protein